MAGPKSKRKYTSDDGVNYEVLIDTSNAVAAGFAAPVGTEANLPRGYAMRHMWAEDAGGVRRKVYHPTGTGVLWTDAGQILSLDVVGAVPANFNVRGRVGEVRRDV